MARRRPIEAGAPPAARPKAYITGYFKVANQPQLIKQRVLVDTGNLLPAACISAEFADQLGVAVQPYNLKVGTAQQGGSLQVVGVVSNLRMAISRNTVVNMAKAIVIRDLSNRVNIGTQVLKSLRADISFKSDAPVLRIQGEEIPIVSHLRAPLEESSGGSVGTGGVGSGGDVGSGGGTGPGGSGGEVGSGGGTGPGDLRRVLGTGPSMTTQFEKISSSFKDFEGLHCLSQKDLIPPDLEPIVNNCNNLDIINNLSVDSACRDASFDSDVIANSGNANFEQIRAKIKHIGVRAGKRVKVVRVSTRGKVSVDTVFPCPGSSQGRLIVTQSHLLAPHTVTRVEARFIGPPRAKSLFVHSVGLGEEEGAMVTEGVYTRQRGGVVQLLVGNSTDESRGIGKGFEVPCDPLMNGSVRVDRKEYVNSMKKETQQPSPEAEELSGEEEAEKSFQAAWSALNLEDNKLLKEHPNVRRKARRLVYLYRDVFSEDGEPGETDLVTLKLKLKEGTEPIRQKYRTLNPRMAEDLRGQIEAWLEQGVIEESDSPWSSPLVPVRKKDGTVRWAVDFRRLNQHLEQDSYPLPRIQQLLERAGGHRVYSALDASAAYFNIVIDPDSRKLTAFATPSHLYQFRKMPFGLSTAPAVYSRFIACALNRIGTKGINIYLDDVLVFSDSLNEHVERLEEVLRAHQEAGIKLKAKKTFLFQESVEYLGHTLSREGIGMIPSYTERIVEWPTPKSVKELNTLLGFLSYYRSFIPNFADLTAQMNEQKKRKTLDWTEEMSRNLHILKQEFQKSPIRGTPRFDLEETFQLTTDFSSAAISAILSQVQDGKERLLAAVGRKTTVAERNYPSWKGELSAIIYGVRKFAPILSYRRFRINTDSKALTYFTSLKADSGMLSRWREELQTFDFEVKHRPGKQNLNADALSRRVDMPEPSPEEEEEQRQYVGSVQEKETDGYTGQLARENIFRAQVEDPILKQVRVWVSQERLPDKLVLRSLHRDAQNYAQLFSTIRLEEDGLLSQEVDTFLGKQKRILVPEELKEAVFKMSHEHRSAGHFGTTATLARIKKHFFYPGMPTDVNTRVGVCLDCLAKITKAKLKAGVHVPQQCGYPLQTLFIDLVGPLPKTSNGHQYIMSVQDGYSRFISLHPLASKESKGVVNALMEGYIKVFGCPGRIHSDQGKEFTSNLFEELARRLEIKHTLTPPYNPQSNNVERYHKTLNAMLRVLLERKDVEWDRLLSAITLAYNTKVNSSTGVTPSLAFLGREAKLPVDLILGVPDRSFDTPDFGVKEWLNRYTRIYAFMRKNQDAVIRRNTQQYIGTAKFHVDDVVWYFTARRQPGKPGKITNAWTGPWKVVERVAEVLYRICPYNPNDTHRAMTVHVGRLRKFKGKPAVGRLPKDLELDMEDEEGVEVSPTSIPTETAIPIYIPAHAPEMRDIARAPRQPDPVEEKVAAPAQRQEVEDTMESSNQEEPVSNRPGPSGGEGVGDSQMPSPQQERRESRESLKRGREGESSEESDWEVARPVVKQGRGVLARFRDSFNNYREAAAQKGKEDSSDEEMHSLSLLTIPVKRGCRLPHKASEGAAGFDIYATQAVKLPPDKVTAVCLGLSVKLPDQHFVVLKGRSSLEKQGIILCGGVIDSDFTGTWSCLLYNSTGKPYTVEKHQRVCQALVLKHENVNWSECDQLPETGRGHGAFGSTGNGVSDRIPDTGGGLPSTQDRPGLPGRLDVPDATLGAGTGAGHGVCGAAAAR